MPYVPRAVRVVIREGDTPQTPGALNFAITDLCVRYCKLHNDISYNTINDVIGVLECAKLEFYRRVAVIYEDQKIKENGDVYPA